VLLNKDTDATIQHSTHRYAWTF